jgi:Lecithin retinol acyltransferase
VPDPYPLGAHLVTPRRGYLHHGIYAGAGRVIHYSGIGRGWRAGPVEEVTLAAFADGRTVQARARIDARFGPAERVARARSRLGEDRYRVFSNNCEHFCEWCVSGAARSRQVETMQSLLRRPLQSFAALARIGG